MNELLLRRRSLLLGGCALGVAPWLKGVMRTAKADASAPPFSLICRVGNGLMPYAYDGKLIGPSTKNWLWPHTALPNGGKASTPLTTAYLEGADRRHCALQELSEYAPRMIAVRGLIQAIRLNDHTIGAMSGLTGAGYYSTFQGDPSKGIAGNQGRETTCLGVNNNPGGPGQCTGDGYSFRPRGESIDNLIARTLTPDSPDALLLGLDGGTGANVSYGRPTGELHADGQPRYAPAARSFTANLEAAYRAIFGDAYVDAQTQAALAGRRASANDFAKEQIAALKRNTKYSSDDQRRLDQHLQLITDIEKAVFHQCKPLEGGVAQAIALDQPGAKRSERYALLAKMVALAINCGKTRSVVVGLGHGNFNGADFGNDYVEAWEHVEANGKTVVQNIFPTWSPDRQSFAAHASIHSVGHNEIGVPLSEIERQSLLHYADRYRLREFKMFLRELDAIKDGASSLLDQGVCTFYADNASSDHHINNLGYITVGGAGGALKTGQYLQLGPDGETPNDPDKDPYGNYRDFNHAYTPVATFLNTLGAAVGVKNSKGEPLNDLNALNNGGQGGRIDDMLNLSALA